MRTTGRQSGFEPRPSAHRGRVGAPDALQVATRDAGRLAPQPAHTTRRLRKRGFLAIAGDGVQFVVWDAEAGEHITIGRAAMVENLMDFAATLRPGSPARGEWERKAIQVAEGATLSFMTADMLPVGEG